MFKNQRGLLITLLLMAPVYTLQAQQPSGKLTPEQAQTRQIELLERRVSAMTDLVLRVDALQREVQQLRGEIEVQNHSLDALKKRQRDLYLDVDQRLNQLSHGSALTPDVLSQGVSSTADSSAEVAAPVTSAEVGLGAGSTPAPVAPNSKVAPSSPPALATPIDPVAEEAEYKQAFSLLMQRRYAEASKAFQRFLSRYSGGSYADNAQYWLAEASYVTRDFEVALAAFQKVVNDYPNSSKVPDAMLKTSFIQYEKQQWAEARDTLKRLVTLYPTSTASRLATQRLDRMQAEGH